MPVTLSFQQSSDSELEHCVSRSWRCASSGADHPQAGEPDGYRTPALQPQAGRQFRQRKSAGGDPRRSVNPARLLLVDDDPGLLKLLGMRLVSEGYSVVTAESGPEALRVLGREKVDLVISDLRMDGNGRPAAV